MHIVIINGPNLNLLGKRETDIYGNMPFEKYLDELKNKFPQVEFSYYQSNIEGEIITKIQETGFKGMQRLRLVSIDNLLMDELIRCA